MTRLHRLVTIAGLFTCFCVSSARADSLSFTLNVTFTGPTNAGTLTPGGPFGTVTLSDGAANTSWLDFTVDMFPQGGIPNFALDLYLNWSGPLDLKFGGIEYEWVVAGANVDKVTYKPNDLGSGYQYLDIEIAEKNQPDPWSGTLILRQKSNTSAFYDLGPSTFNVLSNDAPFDNNAKVTLAVLQELKTQPSSTFSMVGSTGPTSNNGTVPEPASLVLLATGILVLGARSLRSRRR